MNFLFWNLNKKQLKKEIQLLTDEYNIDVLILAEDSIGIGELLTELNSTETKYFYSPPRNPVYDKIRIYTKFSSEFSKSIADDSRTTIRELKIPYLEESFILVAVHYQSKMYWDEANQAAQATELKEMIDKAERKMGHRRTIVVGDFNMNPFEHGMVQTTGLHSVMDRVVADKEKKSIGGNEYFYFYNPMWSFMGDMSRGKVSGTYYYNPANPINYYWNTYDQILMRPEIIKIFDNDSLDIITEIGGIQFLASNGIIDKKFSDHLPIKFKINI